MTDLAIDLDSVSGVLRQALSECAERSGTVVPGALKGRNRSAELGNISKDLLHLAHLCDKARVLALDEYHRIRGFDATRGAPEGRSA